MMTIEELLRAYVRELKAVRDIVSAHHVQPWTATLTHWIESLAIISSPPALMAHVGKSLQALTGGMGSLNDLNISAKAGDEIQGGAEVEKRVNATLKAHLHALYEVARDLSRHPELAVSTQADLDVLRLSLRG